MFQSNPMIHKSRNLFHSKVHSFCFRVKYIKIVALKLLIAYILQPLSQLIVQKYRGLFKQNRLKEYRVQYMTDLNISLIINIMNSTDL